MSPQKMSVVVCWIFVAAASGVRAQEAAPLVQEEWSARVDKAEAPEPARTEDAPVTVQEEEAPVEPDVAAPEIPPDAGLPRGPYASISVGAGIGARAISIPSRRSDRRLSTGTFPSVQVGLHGEVALRRLLLGAAATYNTAVGLRAASIMPTSGTSVDGAQLRSSSLTLGVVPGMRFGESIESVTLRVFVGWGFRSMHTVVDLETPSFSLHGPTLRPELTVPLNDGMIIVCFAPELQIIAGASRALAALSDTSLPGVALGGEASLQVRLFDSLYAAVAYRESYALVDTAWGSYVRDSERFVTLQLSLHRH